MGLWKRIIQRRTIWANGCFENLSAQWMNWNQMNCFFFLFFFYMNFKVRSVVEIELLQSLILSKMSIIFFPEADQNGEKISRSVFKGPFKMESINRLKSRREGKKEEECVRFYKSLSTNSIIIRWLFIVYLFGIDPIEILTGQYINLSHNLSKLSLVKWLNSAELTSKFEL